MVYAYKVVVVVPLLFLALLVLVTSSPLQVVSIDGICKSSSVIGNFVVSQALGKTSSPCPVAAAFDCASETDGYSVLNSILETSFSPNSKGLHMDLNDRGAFLYTAFESMYSAKFCGSKAADYCGSVANCVFVLLSGKDSSETLNGYDQLFRRMLTKIHASSSPVRSLTFFVKLEGPSGGASGVDIGGVTQEITRRLNDIWVDLTGEGRNLSDSIALDVIAVDVSDVASIQYARASVAAAVEKAITSGAASVPSALGTSLSTAWSEIPAGVPRAALNPAQRRSLLAIEAAYTAGIAQIESAVGQWQARVGDGKVVGKFGDRVQQLISSVRKAYSTRTAGALTVRDRADRARQLEDYLLTAVTELFRQQLAILQSSTTTSFRRALVKLAGSTEGLQPDEEQQALRKALFDLRAAASDMEVETLGLTSAAMQAEMSSSLQALATEFPETAAAKLEEVKKIEKQTKKPAKKKGKRGINPSLNLVGMLRPPGFGNLQGFLGYSTGLLGLPLELLLGVQNDGDSPEIMGEDREHPILRLQPKVHLDIDL